MLVLGDFTRLDRSPDTQTGGNEHDRTIDSSPRVILVVPSADTSMCS